MEKPLTPKQQRFVDEYLKDLNATQAAIRAGYAKHTADVQGPRLLGNVRVAEAIAKGQKKKPSVARSIKITSSRDSARLPKRAWPLKPMTHAPPVKL